MASSPKFVWKSGLLCIVPLLCALAGAACDDKSATSSDSAADSDHDHDHDADDGGSEHEHEHDTSVAIGPMTGATCPDNSTLTYDNFGKAYFNKYCQHCHASTVKGDARMGAPADHVFDTLDEIMLLAPHIDEYAGSGPLATNTHMPPATTTPIPSTSERMMMSEWLACGAP